MTDRPVDLDEHRGMAAQKETETRRLRHEVQADQAVLRVREEELETNMVAAAAVTWPEAATKARYLIGLYDATPDAHDTRRQNLIPGGLADLARAARRM